MMLQDWDDRSPWVNSFGDLTTTEVLRGEPETGFTVVLANCARAPLKADLHAAFASRFKGHAGPILVCVQYPSPSGQSFALRLSTATSIGDRVAAESATRTLREQLG